MIDYFKFQSDSINTDSVTQSVPDNYALNSNLILLIPDAEMRTAVRMQTLNSNLILLIRCNW